MGWFEDRAARRRSVLVLPTVETYYKKYDLYLTLEQYWQLMVDEYNRYISDIPENDTRDPRDDHYRKMDFSEFLSKEWYDVLRYNAKWFDEDYARTRPYRLWVAARETAYEQAEYAKWRKDLKPVITWPDRRRNMVRVHKRTGEK